MKKWYNYAINNYYLVLTNINAYMYIQEVMQYYYIIVFTTIKGKICNN